MSFIGGEGSGFTVPSVGAIGDILFKKDDKWSCLKVIHDVLERPCACRICEAAVSGAVSQSSSVHLEKHRYIQGLQP